MSPPEVAPGFELARRHLEASALSSFRADLGKSLAAETATGMASAEAAIGRVIADCNERCKELAPQVSGSLAMQQSIAEDFARFAKLASLPRGLMESVQSQANAVQRVVEDNGEKLRRVAEMNPHHLPLLEMRQSMGSLIAVRARCDIGSISELHIPVRNHAVPRQPSQRLARSGRFRDHLPDRAPFPSPSEAPEQSAGWLDDNLDDELLARLSRFIQSEEIPSDAREVLNAIRTLCQLNQNRLTSDNRLELDLIVQAFIGAQFGLPTSKGSHQQLSSGLLVPRLNNQDRVAQPDLEPRIYTSKELAEYLSYDEATIRRKAAASWQEGAGAQPLKGIPDWYVVERGNNNGGRRCGWKFQQRKRA
jgi:hypothetical protein